MTDEFAQAIAINNNQLLSIIHPGQITQTTGVLVIVGGPQYRVGSHRQFVQLARVIAQSGYSTMRFDYRGMGDASGVKAEFDDIDGDIKAAIDVFFEHQPHLQRVVIWGLCDAASAAVIYGYNDERVAGLVLLNPWLRSDQAMGKAMLKFYYVQRLISKDFWQKLLAGKVNVSASVKDVKGFASDSIRTTTQQKECYQQRMLAGIQAFEGKVLLVLSGNDLTAKEFEQQAFSNKHWKKALKPHVTIHRISDADHTFSCRQWKQNVELATLNFLQSIK
ncbi:hydrolase 1, exosortase A system-associated [Colwellia sp. MEBiC06753]